MRRSGASLADAHHRAPAALLDGLDIAELSRRELALAGSTVRVDNETTSGAGSCSEIALTSNVVSSATPSSATSIVAGSWCGYLR